MENQQPVNNEEFEELLELFKNNKSLLDKESKDYKLKLFSAGKQGKFGNNTTPKPGMFDLIEKAKWQAWKDREGQDQEACKREFLELAKAVLAKKQ